MPSQTANRSVQSFLHSRWTVQQSTAESPYTLQWAAPSPLKLPLIMWGSGPPCNTWFPGPTQVFNPNGLLIGSAVSVSAGLTSVTDRLTDQLLGRLQ